MNAPATLKKGQLVRMVWHDAQVTNDWTDEADLEQDNNDESLLCETVGFFIRGATAKSPIYVVASTRGKDDNGKYEYNAITKIPKAWVTEIQQLKEETNDE